MPELRYGPFLRDLANKIQTPIVFGSLAYEPHNISANTFRYFNSAFLASPWSEAFTRYDKIHLVPFGEYVPLKAFLPFVEKMVVGIGDFSPGHHYLQCLMECCGWFGRNTLANVSNFSELPLTLPVSILFCQLTGQPCIPIGKYYRCL